MQPASVNGPGTGILTGASVNSRSRRIFGDGAQPVGSRERADGAVAVALIVGGRTPAGGSAAAVRAAEIIVEAEVEIDALHFAVGDPVEAGAELVVDRQANGIADGFFAISRPEQIGMGVHVGDEFLEPARKRPASDDRCGDR